MPQVYAVSLLNNTSTLIAKLPCPNPKPKTKYYLKLPCENWKTFATASTALAKMLYVVPDW